MAYMRYYRRPNLAGNSIRRNGAATLRGNSRRKGADGTSTSPYFAGVNPNDTLIISSQDGQLTVQLPSGKLHEIIAAINVTAPKDVAHGGIRVEAFDSNGCLGLRSTIFDGTSWVRVDGGTASKAVGFDTSLRQFRAFGSDITTSSEGRIGQPFDSALPVPGENFSTDVFVRAMARVMANDDVLYAELMKQEPVVKKIGTVTAAATALDYWDVGATKLYTGWKIGAPALTVTSSPEELANYFFLVDTVTKAPGVPRVVGVVDSTAANALGVETQVTTGSILELVDGRIIRIGGSLFGVEVGDHVRITGASGLAWDYNGYRWIIEEILPGNHLALRPASPVESAIGATSPDDNHPVIELPPHKAGAVFGTFTVFKGAFRSGLRLRFNPPVPPNGVFDVWAAVPSSTRERALETRLGAGKGVSALLSPQKSSLADGLLERPTLSLSAGGVQVSGYAARWRGKAVQVPAAQVSSIVDGVNFVIWDPADGMTKMAPLWDPSYVLIGRATVAGGVTTAVSQTTRLDGLSSTSLTVGTRGQFSTLQSALDYAATLRSAGDETQFEIVLLENTAVPNTGWTIDPTIVGISIKGASPGVELTWSGHTHYAFGQASTTIIEVANFTVANDAALALLFDPANARAYGRSLRTLANGEYLLYWAVGGSRTWLQAQAGLSTFNTSAGQELRIGMAANRVVIGGTEVSVQGTLIAENGVVIPSIRNLRWGEIGNHPHVTLGPYGADQGGISFGKEGEVPVALSKDHVDVLRGGATSDAQTLHTHQNIVDDLATTANGLAAEITARSTMHLPAERIDEATAGQMLDIRATDAFLGRLDVFDGTFTVRRPYSHPTEGPDDVATLTDYVATLGWNTGNGQGRLQLENPLVSRFGNGRWVSLDWQSVRTLAGPPSGLSAANADGLHTHSIAGITDATDLVRVSTAQTVTGVKTFTQQAMFDGGALVYGDPSASRVENGYTAASRKYASMTGLEMKVPGNSWYAVPPGTGSGDYTYSWYRLYELPVPLFERAIGGAKPTVTMRVRAGGDDVGFYMRAWVNGLLATANTPRGWVGASIDTGSWNAGHPLWQSGMAMADVLLVDIWCGGGGDSRVIEYVMPDCDQMPSLHVEVFAWRSYASWGFASSSYVRSVATPLLEYNFTAPPF